MLAEADLAADHCRGPGHDRRQTFQDPVGPARHAFRRVAAPPDRSRADRTCESPSTTWPRSGFPGLVVVLLAVTVTFFGAQWLGRRMGVSPDLSLLIGTGYSICGVSAVAAMNGVVGADEEEAAYAIGLVTLAGSLSIVVLPLLGTILGMTPADFGTWVGGAVHDVAQTVATASTKGDAALAAAIVVKLTRVALLAPLVVGVALARRSRTVRLADCRPGLP